MTNQDLIKEIDQTIQQFILINNKKGGYQQISIFIEDKQFFADQMSQYAIIENKSYVLISASDVSNDQKELIIAQAIDTFDPKAIFRISETKAFSIENNHEIELSDISVIENLFNKIHDTLIDQLKNQAESIANKIKVGTKNELEENEKINKFLTTFVNQKEIIFKLTGDNLVKSLTGNSINSLIEQYVNEAKSFLQPNELMSLESPNISVNFGSELFSIYEIMSPKSQSIIKFLITVNDSIYLNLFSILKHKAIFGSNENKTIAKPINQEPLVKSDTITVSQTPSFVDNNSRIIDDTHSPLPSSFDPIGSGQNVLDENPNSIDQNPKSIFSGDQM